MWRCEICDKAIGEYEPYTEWCDPRDWDDAIYIFCLPCTEQRRQEDADWLAGRCPDGPAD